MDIKYDIKLIIKRECIKWGVYENGALLDTFDTKEQARRYLSAWQKVMR